jgi:peptidoglycan/xylan/chitin deacetylase (PgdA/CDA1 family)
MQRFSEFWVVNGVMVRVVAVVALIVAALAPPFGSASPVRALAGEETPTANGPRADVGRDIRVLGDIEIISEEVLTHLASCTIGSVVRLAGEKPYEIAAEVSRDRFAEADTVYVTAVEAFSETVGAMVAAVGDAPVLLVERNALPAATIAELVRLAPSEIVVIGDGRVVDESVETALAAYTERVVRTWKADGFPTTVAPAPVLVATASTVPDTVVAIVAAGKVDEPILVVNRDGVPEAAAATITRLTGVPCEPFEATPTCAAGWIALTYDDGPNPERTDAVLAALKRAGVKATFFTVGYLVEAYPSYAQKIAAAGHAIANHANEHEILTKLSDAAITETLNTADAKIRAAGVEPIGLVRPPGGTTSARVKAVIEQAGYRQILWTTGPFDYDGKSASAIANDVIAHAEDGAVVVLHDNSNNYDNTAEATGTIVQVLKDQGYCFGVLDGTGSIVS